MSQPKFKIGDIVKMEDDFHFNPANEVRSIGMVKAIHVYHGRAMGYRPGLGETRPRSYEGRISYTISGFSLIPDEKDLELYEGGDI